MKRIFLATLLLAFIVAACATTTINSTWKDPAFATTPKKVFVVAVLKSETNRRFLEDEFVRQLAKSGVDAVASYQSFGEAMPKDKELILAKLQESGADTILINRLVDKRTEERYAPGSNYAVNTAYYRSWPGYYGATYSTVYTNPGYMVTDQYAVAESNLYSVANEGLLWAVNTDTWLNDPAIPLLKGYVATVTKAMRDDEIIK